MDTKKIEEVAAKLEGLLLDYSRRDSEAMSLLEDLRPLFLAAKEGRISSPMEWRDIPGGYFFTEGTLRKYRDVEATFAEFRIELTGGDNPVLDD